MSIAEAFESKQNKALQEFCLKMNIEHFGTRKSGQRCQTCSILSLVLAHDSGIAQRQDICKIRLVRKGQVKYFLPKCSNIQFIYCNIDLLVKYL